MPPETHSSASSLDAEQRREVAWLRAEAAREISRAASERLAASSVPEPESSAEILLSELLGVQRGELYFCKGPFTRRIMLRYGRWIARRLRREPVQRILGYAYFRNLKLELDESTLIPRSDTESVVEAALERIDGRGFRRVLDLGTGSGAIAISIAQERPKCEVHASDVSEEALRVARRNAGTNGANVEFHRADIAENLDSFGGFDLLVSNPPYIESDELQNLAPEVRDWDPASALDGGLDGLDFYRRIFAGIPSLLRDGAEVVLEVGDGQAGDVSRLGENAGFTSLGTRDDLAGISRAVLFEWGR